MLIDEMGNLGRMDAFTTAATLLRGYGVRLATFWQSPAQLECYGPDAKTIIDNAGVIQLFGPRNFRMAQDFVNLVGGISAEQIMAMRPEEQLLLVEGGLPRVTRKVRYFQEPEFNKMVAGQKAR